MKLATENAYWFGTELKKNGHRFSLTETEDIFIYKSISLKPWDVELIDGRRPYNCSEKLLKMNF